MRVWCIFGRSMILAVLFVFSGLISPVVHAEDGEPWLEGISRARPTLDPYGNSAFEMTSTRYGHIYLRPIDRKGLTSAVFEEVTTINVPGRGIESHTRLRVWSYNENRPVLERPLYTIEANCDEGMFVFDTYTPEIYELMCGEDYRFRRMYKVSDGTFVGESDYDPASLVIKSESRSGRVWVIIRIMDYKTRELSSPPYPFALLTYMTIDGVLDRIVVAQDDRHYAELIASLSDSSHGLAFGNVGGLAMIVKATTENDLPSVRLVYSIWSDPSQQIIIPLTMTNLRIDKTELPKGFSLIRVPPTGSLDHGFMTPAVRSQN